MTTDKGKKKERGQTKKQISKEDVVVVVVAVISLLAFRRNVVRSRLTMVRSRGGTESMQKYAREREREKESERREKKSQRALHVSRI